MRRTSGPGAIAGRGADILRAAREELARADAKATTLFATAGVAVRTVLRSSIPAPSGTMTLASSTIAAIATASIGESPWCDARCA
jgi:hypothetical protein